MEDGAGGAALEAAPQPHSRLREFFPVLPKVAQKQQPLGFDPKPLRGFQISNASAIVTLTANCTRLWWCPNWSATVRGATSRSAAAGRRTDTAAVRGKSGRHRNLKSFDTAKICAMVTVVGGRAFWIKRVVGSNRFPVVH